MCLSPAVSSSCRTSSPSSVFAANPRKAHTGAAIVCQGVVTVIVDDGKVREPNFGHTDTCGNTMHVCTQATFLDRHQAHYAKSMQATPFTYFLQNPFADLYIGNSVALFLSEPYDPKESATILGKGPGTIVSNDLGPVTVNASTGERWCHVMCRSTLRQVIGTAFVVIAALQLPNSRLELGSSDTRVALALSGTPCHATAALKRPPTPSPTNIQGHRCISC